MLLKQKYITAACGKGGLGYLLSSFIFLEYDGVPIFSQRLCVFRV